MSMPYLLRNAGVAVDRIAGISALALAPAVWYFVWAPLADIGLAQTYLADSDGRAKRGLLARAMRLPLPSQLGRFVPLVVAGSALSTIVAAANGGLMAATLEDNQRGHASGWFQAGYTGGGAVGAGTTLWLCAPRFHPSPWSCVVALMVFVPSLAAFLIVEPEAGHKPGTELFTEMLRDLKVMFSFADVAWRTGNFVVPARRGRGRESLLRSRRGLPRLDANRGLDHGLRRRSCLPPSAPSPAASLPIASPRRVAYALAALVSSVCAIGMLIAPQTPADIRGGSIALPGHHGTFVRHLSGTHARTGRAARAIRLHPAIALCGRRQRAGDVYDLARRSGIQASWVRAVCWEPTRFERDCGESRSVSDSPDAVRKDPAESCGTARNGASNEFATQSALFLFAAITQARRTTRWPDANRLAVYVALNVEQYRFGEGIIEELVPGGPQPDVLNYSWCDYGTRVGVWRLLDALEEFHIPVTFW